MEQLAPDFPEDAEAKIFDALALLATATPGDRTFAQQKQAAAILNGLLEKHPKHPGLHHYTIHAFDYPALATLALPAARATRRPPGVAARAPHAVAHLTRLGLWDESHRVEHRLGGRGQADRRALPSRRGVLRRAPRDGLSRYAYLQQGKETEARKSWTKYGQHDRFDEPNFAAAYALVAVPARSRWSGATGVRPRHSRFQLRISRGHEFPTSGA